MYWPGLSGPGRFFFQVMCQWARTAARPTTHRDSSPASPIDRAASPHRRRVSAGLGTTTARSQPARHVRENLAPSIPGSIEASRACRTFGQALTLLRSSLGWSTPGLTGCSPQLVYNTPNFCFESFRELRMERQVRLNCSQLPDATSIRSPVDLRMRKASVGCYPSPGR